MFIVIAVLFTLAKNFMNSARKFVFLSCCQMNLQKSNLHSADCAVFKYFRPRDQSKLSENITENDEALNFA